MKVQLLVKILVWFICFIGLLWIALYKNIIDWLAGYKFIKMAQEQKDAGNLDIIVLKLYTNALFHFKRSTFPFFIKKAWKDWFNSFKMNDYFYGHDAHDQASLYQYVGTVQRWDADTYEQKWKIWYKAAGDLFAKEGFYFDALGVYYAADLHENVLRIAKPMIEKKELSLKNNEVEDDNIGFYWDGARLYEFVGDKQNARMYWMKAAQMEDARGALFFALEFYEKALALEFDKKLALQLAARAYNHKMFDYAMRFYYKSGYYFNFMWSYVLGAFSFTQSAK